MGDRVALAAPTGRAAKRLSELTGRKAKTIHRLLEVDYTNNDTVRFIHNEKNLLKCDVVVIDEMSMVDVMLFESLLLALKPQCKIIMVGDEDQLPSVGAGNVLGGVIASGRSAYDPSAGYLPPGGREHDRLQRAPHRHRTAARQGLAGQ